MTILSPGQWRLRELAYRTGEPVEDIASREGVTLVTVRTWASTSGWIRFGPEMRLLQLRLELALDRVEAAMDADDAEEAARRLRSLATYVRMKRLAGALEGETEQGDSGHDSADDANAGNDAGTDDRSLEDIRRELDEILPRGPQ